MVLKIIKKYFEIIFLCALLALVNYPVHILYLLAVTLASILKLTKL